MKITKETKLIGIAGVAHSGKNEVAKMIDYIQISSNPKFELYQEATKYTYFPMIYEFESFANKLKAILCNLYNIPRNYLEVTEYKENYYYLFDKNIVISKDELSEEYFIYDVPCPLNISLSKYINIQNKKVAIKLRNLMQYFGTDIIRNNLGEDVWVNACINCVNINKKHGTPTIITDVRFPNEAKAIKDNNGILIKVVRNNEIDNNHESEKIDFDADITIINNGSLENLFNNVKEIIDKE